MAAENKVIGWHHQFNGYEFEETLGDTGRQGRLSYFSSWSHKETNMI